MNKFVALCAASALFVSSAFAEKTVLVELFASKHCLGSKTAKKHLKSNMDASEDVLVLTWPVNYWFYLGEDDAPIVATSAERQAAYVQRFGLRGAYTPHTVYNGAAHCAGHKKNRVEKAIKKAREAQSGVSVSFANEGYVTVTGPENHSADVLLVEYDKNEADREKMLHMVTSVKNFGEWSGGNLSIQAPNCVGPCAMLVQEKGQGVVYGAIDLTDYLTTN